MLIGHLARPQERKAPTGDWGSSTWRQSAVCCLLSWKDSPTTRVLIREKPLAPPGHPPCLFSWETRKSGFELDRSLDITVDELRRADTAKTESKTAQAQMLILELLADGKMSAELEKAVNERGFFTHHENGEESYRDRLVTEKDGTAWVCYLHRQQEHGKRGKDGKVLHRYLNVAALPCSHHTDAAR